MDVTKHNLIVKQDGNCTVFLCTRTIITPNYLPSFPPIPSISSFYLYTTHLKRSLWWRQSANWQYVCNSLRVNWITTAKIITRSTVIWAMYNSTSWMLRCHLCSQLQKRERQFKIIIMKFTVLSFIRYSRKRKMCRDLWWEILKSVDCMKGLTIWNENMKIVLQDTERYFVDCTHWETFADMFLALVNTVMHI
jgi:hypothetical protein